MPVIYSINVVQWHSPASIFICNTPDITKLNVFENYIFKRTSPSAWGQPSYRRIFWGMTQYKDDVLSVWIPTMEIWRSFDGLISAMWIPILVRPYLYTDSGSWFTNNNWIAPYDQTMISPKAPHSWSSQDCFGMPTLGIMMKTDHVMIGHAIHM